MSGGPSGEREGHRLGRRDFLTRAAALLGGVTVLAGAGRPPLPRRFDAVGVQLYTLRTLLAESVPATLDLVAEIGYGEVELAGLHGVAPTDFRSLLDARGLRAPSTHLGLDALAPDALEATLETAEVLGNWWVIVPSLARDQLSPTGLPAVLETLQRAGERARERGIGIGFHNHAAEFAPWPDGRVPLHVMIDETDPGLVSFQLDLFWAVDAGHDPLPLLRAHEGRFVSVHVKDRTAAGEMVTVGEGTLDFATLLSEAERLGVRHAFVEHDRPKDPAATARQSYQYLRRVLDPSLQRNSEA